MAPLSGGDGGETKVPRFARDDNGNQENAGEGARHTINFYCSRVPPLVGGSSSGARTTAAATRSPGSMCKRRTPWALRPDSRMVLESMRMILPYWLINITWEFSSTSAIATTLPTRSVVLILITPFPARFVRRYSSAGVRLP